MHSLKIPGRAIVHSQDIVRITGMSIRSAQRILNAIREEHCKKRKQYVTIDELCTHWGIKQEQIIDYFR